MAVMSETIHRPMLRPRESHPCPRRTRRGVAPIVTLILSSSASSSYGLATPNPSTPDHRVPLRTRRHVVDSWAMLALLSTFPATAWSDDLPVDSWLLQICQDDSLSQEQAIPGAYSQVCMSIPVREIPVRGQYGIVRLSLEQRTAAAGSTGMAIWNSSLLLKRLLERIVEMDPDWFMGKNVVELGCGAGLISMAAAVLGAQKVVATDGKPFVVDLARRNVERNALQEAVVVQQLQWGLMDAMDLANSADIMLGADLTYSPGSWRQLAESMETILADNGTILYLSLGHTGFNVNAEVDGFLAVANEIGLEMVEPSSTEWPLPKTKKSLSAMLLDGSSLNDREVIQGTGGVRLIVLRKKLRRR